MTHGEIDTHGGDGQSQGHEGLPDDLPPLHEENN
jgi:hypothetical protein